MGFALEVGFSVEGGVVACGAKNFWEDLLVPVKGVSVVHEAIFMAVLSAHDDGAGGTADGVGAERVFEEHAVSGELVDFRGGVDGFEPAIVGADGVGGVVVGEEEDDVGALLLGEECEREQEKDEQ